MVTKWYVRNGGNCLGTGLRPVPVERSSTLLARSARRCRLIWQFWRKQGSPLRLSAYRKYPRGDSQPSHPYAIIVTIPSFPQLSLSIAPLPEVFSDSDHVVPAPGTVRTEISRT